MSHLPRPLNGHGRGGLGRLARVHQLKNGELAAALISRWAGGDGEAEEGSDLCALEGSTIVNYPSEFLRAFLRNHIGVCRVPQGLVAERVGVGRGRVAVVGGVPARKLLDHDRPAHLLPGVGDLLCGVGLCVQRRIPAVYVARLTLLQLNSVDAALV